MTDAALNDNEPRGLVVEIAERRDDPGVWTVEAVDEGSEGEVYQVLFIGPSAEQFARDYAAWKYGIA